MIEEMVRRPSCLIPSCLLILATTMLAEDWPEWRGKGRRGEFNETGILDTFPTGGLKVKWRTPIRAGFTGPAVASGRVFVTDFQTVKPDSGPVPGAEINLR